HIIYALSLQYGYKIGDLSLVYPIARGTGPFIVAISAIFLYGETITWKSGSGILLIMVSIFILSGGMKIFTSPDTTVSILFGVFLCFFFVIFFVCFYCWCFYCFIVFSFSVCLFFFFFFFLYYYFLFIFLVQSSFV